MDQKRTHGALYCNNMKTPPITNTPIVCKLHITQNLQPNISLQKHQPLFREEYIFKILPATSAPCIAFISPSH